MRGETSLVAQIEAGVAKTEGNVGILAELAAMLVEFDLGFEIMPGTKGRRPRIELPFADVRWSGPHARADTLSNLGHDKVTILEEMGDIDDGADFRRWQAARR